LATADERGIAATTRIDDLFDMSGRVAIVTGGSRGLGREMALAFAAHGADLVIASRKVSNCEAVADEVRAMGRKALAVPYHAASWAGADELAAAAYDEFGRVDVLMNNAGVGKAVPAMRETAEEFRAVIDVNLNGSYWMAQACARVMKPGSAIVNISSVLGLTTAGLPQAAYSASKAGVMGLTRDLAQQWSGRKGIRVNALAPGFFASEITDTLKPGHLDSLMPRIILGRLGDAAELAATALWLASPAAGYVTGQTIVVDGGLTIA
jgi:NAD(P)-dependent dehydrogenase (short-subunit alcohol dehydrogenase family)